MKCCACSTQCSSRRGDRKSTRLNSSHSQISYAVFCLKKKKQRNSVLASQANFILWETARPSKELNESSATPGILVRREVPPHQQIYARVAMSISDATS